MKIRFGRRSKAAACAVPVLPGAAPPKPKRAAAAGFTGRAGQASEVATRRRRLLLLGMGTAPDFEAGDFKAGDFKAGDFKAGDFEAAGALAVARLSGLERIAIDARGLPPDAAAGLAAGAALRAWRFHRFLTRPDPAHFPDDRLRLTRLDVLVDDPDAAEAAWAAIRPGVEGALFARDLVAEPSNIMTPAGFATRLARLERAGVSVEVLDAATLRAQGFGGLLAVGGASAHPPCLAVLRWHGTLPGPPLALVGKGITFDTGGVCVKPAHGLWEMRADMAGAAACAGAMLALALRNSPAPVVAVLPLAENALGAASYRPGDVLRLFDGTTVEVVDTDAEGRLVLADALAWVLAGAHPSAVIDLATLTGSIITALGHHMAGLFANDDVLAAHVAAAGTAVGERAWRMPVSDGYREALESGVADLRQCSDGTRQPDACHAAAFLRSFVGDTPWVHLDIAGVESHEIADDRHASGPTGWGVRLLDRLVADRFES